MNSQEIKSNPIVFCFGEVLWDIFPSGAKAGGAPFNVAYNLRKLGVDSRAISRVGTDELGVSLQNLVKGWGFPDAYIQKDANNPTGTVQANFDAQNEAHYDIVYPVAYDFIECSKELLDEVRAADAFVFGSLIARGTKSRQTLLSLLEVAQLKIFDVNLREPYCDFEIIQTLMHQSDIVKMNKAEMIRLLEFLLVPFTNEYDAVRWIQEHFQLKEVLISKGSKGALYFNEQNDYFTPAFPIEVADTVGSGDAFLAGFISKRIQNALPEPMMQTAVGLGAFITAQNGACPSYQKSDFEAFLASQKAIDPLM